MNPIKPLFMRLGGLRNEAEMDRALDVIGLGLVNGFADAADRTNRLGEWLLKPVFLPLDAWNSIRAVENLHEMGIDEF